MLIFAIQFLLNLNSLDLNIIMKNKKYTYVVVKYSMKSNKPGLSPFHAHCIWHQVWLHSHQYKVLLGMSQRFSIEYLHLQHEYVTHALFEIHVYLNRPSLKFWCIMVNWLGRFDFLYLIQSFSPPNSKAMTSNLPF